MKKIILFTVVIISSFGVIAQEPEKKKEAHKVPSKGQEKAISESGVSVKTTTKKTSNTNNKSAVDPSSSNSDNKKSEENKGAKKPE